VLRQFLHNIIAKGIDRRVFPMPMTSSCAYHVLKKLGVTPDLVYIDAGHEETEVAIDLDLYYDLLRPGGVLFGDDYSYSWPGVVAAVNKFAAKHSLLLECGAGKFLLQKPGT
jgi:hypothetical protein